MEEQNIIEVGESRPVCTSYVGPWRTLNEKPSRTRSKPTKPIWAVRGQAWRRAANSWRRR